MSLSKVKPIIGNKREGVLSNGVEHRDQGRGKQGEETIVIFLTGSMVKKPSEN